MTFVQLVLLTTYAVGMTVGQALFKVVAGRADFSSVKTAAALLYDPLFIVAIGLYAGLSIFWVWLLTFTPLSRAYLFIALALVLTAGLAVLAFNEPLTARFAIGVALVVCGLVLVAG